MKPTRSYEVYIDGASLGNPGPAGVGIVFQDGGPAPVRELSRPVGQTTNNVAEYLALLYALHEAVRAGWSRLAVKTDSELLARQINGQYRVRDPFLRCLHDLALDLVAGFDEFTIQHVPREQNAAADRLAGQAAKRQH
ncbi:MAG: ribonuclease H [Candidatus Omnitrophica bacterium CG11_big_fil_rev_8_21_14_0_20_63_9]|nr:MAG: ribonuclease H [Candidatus Omnitrophica bacterium CG11_big_fil_rev_8_21_14_0_20_63_9]